MICEENAYSWIVLACIKMRHSAQCEEPEGLVVEFTIDLETAVRFSFLSATDSEENIVRLNFLFYRLMRKGWLPRDLMQEALKSFTIVKPQSRANFAPRKRYRGVRDARLIGSIPNLGIVSEPSDQPQVSATTHPRKPYYYELCKDMEEEQLGHLASYLVKLEWSTYRRSRDSEWRPDCNWTASLDFGKFIKDANLFNGDIPVSCNSVKDSIGVSFFFDKSFLIKSAKLCEQQQQQQQPPPQSTEDIELTLSSSRKRARKPDARLSQRGGTHATDSSKGKLRLSRGIKHNHYPPLPPSNEQKKKPLNSSCTSGQSQSISI